LPKPDIFLDNQATNMPLPIPDGTANSKSYFHKMYGLSSVKGPIYCVVIGFRRKQIMGRFAEGLRKRQDCLSLRAPTKSPGRSSLLAAASVFTAAPVKAAPAVLAAAAFNTGSSFWYMF